LTAELRRKRIVNSNVGYDAQKPWWTWVLTGFFTLGGVGNVMIAFDPSSVKNARAESPGQAAAGGDGVPNVASSKV